MWLSLIIWATFLTLNYFFHYCSWSGCSLMQQQCPELNLLSEIKLNFHSHLFYCYSAAFAESALVAMGSMELDPYRCLSFSFAVCWPMEPAYVS